MEQRLILIVLIGSLMFFGFSCTSQKEILDKQWLSLEQQKLDLEQEREKRLLNSELFDRKVTCQEMVDRYKKRYNNITGGRYNELLNSCNIEYKVNGEKELGNMETMSDD